MAIKVQNGERDFRKKACAEWCYIDPEFCALCNMKVGESSRALNIKIRRWTDLEENTAYSVNYANKVTPEHCFPRETPQQLIPAEGFRMPKVDGIPDYAEKIRYEHESFTPFSCYGDGSGVEYDIMPENLIGPDGRMERLYDLSYYPISLNVMQLGDWNTWVDKFQKDYRYGQVSDQNAETILFPNVDDPWMFTEYVFKGVGSGEVIVEPPLYDENTLKLKNADTVMPDVEGKYTEFSEVESEGKTKRFVKAFRQVCHWDELNSKETRRNDTRFAVPDSGGKLYRVDVNVQSVKWGEHGNVPPGTINMGAPAEWMDASKSAAHIRPKYVAHIGVPYYASSHGVVYWHDHDAYIDEVGEMTLVDGDKPYYTYEVKEPGPHGAKQNTPKRVRPDARRGQAGVAPANVYLGNGSLSHGGCQLMKGVAGQCKCTAMDALLLDDPELETLKSKFSYDVCKIEHKDCPKYVGGAEFPILADYQQQAYNKAEYNESVLGIYSGDDADKRLWADNLLENSTGLPAADMLVAMGGGTTGRLGRSDIYNPTEVSVWYEAQFEVVYESSNPVQTRGNKSDSNGFGRGVEVIRGTGKQALDTYEATNAFRGDTVFFNDMDQQSFSRWFETPMFCAKSAYCNEICGIAMQSGWDPKERAGSSEGNCRYYRSSNTKGASSHIGCPTTCVQKRAYEFQQTMVTATPVILSIAEMVKQMTDEELEEYNSGLENVYYFEKQNDDIYSFWSKSDSITSELGGVKVKEKKNFDFKTLDEDGEEISKGVECHLFAKARIGNEVEGFFWYQSMDNAGAARDVWFCKCDPKFTEFNRNTLIITNEDKFIGGYHPQYKDYSKRGNEFLQDVESDSYRDAMGDIIGDVDYDGQPQATNKKGYWTDENGDYVISETDIGANVPISDDESRAEPGSPTTISFRKGNTSVDVETGEMTKPKTTNCAVHANDPFDLMVKFSKGEKDPETGKRTGRPMLEDPNGESEPYWAPPYIRNRWALPTMRMAAHCPECDYYIAWRYHDLVCPWCGTRLERIHGDKGVGMDVGDTWGDASIIKKFFKLNAIGKVQVWAPPGTCVPNDGYYWKNPTVVTNTLVRQIKYRLGTFKDNSWQGDKMSAAAEFSLGYPEQLGYFAPTPDFTSEKEDAGEVYSLIKWKGISKEDRSRYSSYNDIMTVDALPGFRSDSSNESVIVPYTDASDDGLKMITAAEIRALRNRIEPILAYSSEIPTQNDYPTKRASYEAREVADIPRYNSRGHCRVPSVILAANDNGIDSHVQFWSGDYEWGTVREYYPPGMSWWWLNKVIGGRYSDLTGGRYHMDGNSPQSGGNRTVSKCAMFIHGILPLDKEILKAYVIFSPAGEPYKEPIGRGWNGLVHYDHFHAMTTNHPNYGDGMSAHLHGQAGTSWKYDENGDPVYNSESITEFKEFPIVPMDESDYNGWAGGSDYSASSSRPVNYRSLFSSSFNSQWTGLPGVRDEGFWKQFGTDKTNVNNSGDPIYSYSKTVNTGLKYNSRAKQTNREDTKFKLIGLDRNGDIRQNYSSEDIWKNMTVSELQEEIDKSLVELEFSVSDGNRENDIKADFVQYADKFITTTIPDQMQSIPGYFDFTGINSEKRLSNVVDINKKSSGGNYDKPVIIQGSGDATSYAGDSSKSQAGSVDRVFDITELFKSHYNTRIERRFSCNAGKTLAAVSTQSFDPPRWEGIGDWENRSESEKWNSQEPGSAVGYLLNDDYSFPKVESDRSIPNASSEGEKYELAPKNIQLLCTFLLPFTISKDNNKYWISSNGEETEIKELPSGNRITTTSGVKNLLESMFGEGYTCKIVSGSSCLVEGGKEGTLEIKEVQGNCYGYFSIPTGTISGVQDRIVAVTSYVSGFYPSGLLYGNSWVTNSYVFEQQNAVFDLARAPLIGYEKNYRYTAPTINCSSCYCPNEDCSTTGMTVGMWAEKKGLSFGNGQTSCPSCGTDVSGEPGAVQNSGDGIYSWYYQEGFAENPFITGIEIKAGEETSFRVSCRNSESSFWSSLLNVVYDSSTKKYTYTYNGKNYITANLPETFLINEKNWRRARYIQIEVDPRQTIEKLEYPVKKVNEYSAKATGNFQNMGLFDWGGLECTVDTTDGKVTRIIASANLNSEETELTFFFSSSILSEGISRVTLSPYRYTSTIEKFKVYGFHYKPSELTMTGSASEKFFLFSLKKSGYNLEEYPTQILGVSIGKNDSGGTILEEVDDRSKLLYTLSQKTVKILSTNGKYEDKIIYVIESGNYYFDPIHNRIYLPTEGDYGGTKVALADFESSLKKAKENISYYPTKMVVRYWTGSGEPITLEARAEHGGPSFQLEKDTITVIENINSLPDNGMSAKMPGVRGAISRHPIPWCCYNHVPATLKYNTQRITKGKFMVPNLSSTTLGTTVDNDKFFVEQFGTNCRRITGTCFTEVTFYGAPDQVLSGTIWAKAPAYTTKKIDTGNGTVLIKERTGGIADGCLIFKVMPKKCKGRKTLAYSMPTIVVYAKERNPQDDF